ncbi:MAG: tetratricopeptide repeat protein, partial [Pyrinomonadaceae bacterium]
PAATPSASTDEAADWTAAIEVPDGSARVAALRRFIDNYPKSEKLADAARLIVTIQTALGNDRLTAGDLGGALEFYRAAASDAPKPVPDQLFAETLAKFPANLYFRGARTEAYDIAAIIEKKAGISVGQLLNIATFYMSVENGSEARRVANAAIKLDPTSSAAYQTLGLANRIDFLLDDSLSAYAKALELDPESMSARRGLAEMKRSMGKAAEAVELYRQILANDAENLPAATGLVLALFDAGERAEAETELAKALEANPGNIILLAGSAYWYAAHNEGERAVNFAQRAIATDPRFIWSHIALARGFVVQGDPVAAEKTLLAARRYGNFPTLEYEIASARAAAGFYREAAEELAKSFSVKDGVVRANLGGRVPRQSKNFTELIGFERRASIFAPTAADSPENAARMTALLQLKQELEKSEPSTEVLAAAVDDFVRGDDKMKVHRQIFAGNQLLEKKVALPKVIELIKSAPQSLDAGLEVSAPAAAVMASELYDSRSLAAVRGDYIEIPEIPKPTLSAILRGRVEEINGWTFYQMDDPAQAVIHLKRAVSVLPPESAWWQSSSWRLGSALMLAGKEADALEAFIRTYKSGNADALRYNTIEALYKRVNGHTLGLEERIGPNPTPQPATRTVARNTGGIPIAQVRREAIPAAAPVLAPTVEPVRSPTPDQIRAIQTPAPTPDPTPDAVPIETPTSEPPPTPSPEESKPVPVPQPLPLPTTTPQPTPTPLPPAQEVKPAPTVEATLEMTPESSPIPSQTPVTSRTPESTPDPSPVPSPSPEEKSKELIAEPTLSSRTDELFPPVIISIPKPETAKISAKPSPNSPPALAEANPGEETVTQPVPKATPESKPTPSAPPDRVAGESRPRRVEGAPAPVDIKPCKLTVSEERITLQNGGGDLAIVVGRDDDVDLDGLTAVSTSPNDVSIRREVITGVKARALFVVRSTSSRPGIYQVKFDMPCGTKELVVRVR